MDSEYSKLIGWEVWNFMTISHAKVEFDNKNIINFKGYNDSGKSAMLRALDVLMFNIKAASQVGFIQDDSEYFRVTAYFDDGIIIMRDKYVNGQSLYEMYKGNDCIFTTRQGKFLSKIADVPQVIKDYLGVIKYDDLALNSRSCFEKQFLVQTSGSENYKFLNAVLRSEEIAVAGAMVNTDKNKLLSDISCTEAELATYKYQYYAVKEVTEDIVNFLKLHDMSLDVAEVKTNVMSSVIALKDEVGSIVNIPDVEPVDFAQLELALGIVNTINSLNSLPNIPEIHAIDSARADALNKLIVSMTQLASIPNIPSVCLVDSEKLEMLYKINSRYSVLDAQVAEINLQSERLDTVNGELLLAKAELEEFGKRFKNCPVCNTLVEVGD